MYRTMQLLRSKEMKMLPIQASWWDWELGHTFTYLVHVACAYVDLVLHVCLALFSLEGFAHAECNAALVQCLVGGNCHPDLITDTE